MHLFLQESDTLSYAQLGAVLDKRILSFPVFAPPPEVCTRDNTVYDLCLEDSLNCLLHTYSWAVFTIITWRARNGYFLLAISVHESTILWIVSIRTGGVCIAEIILCLNVSSSFVFKEQRKTQVKSDRNDLDLELTGNWTRCGLISICDNTN